MSALPPTADMCGPTWDVRFGPKADLCSAKPNVRYGPIADIRCRFFINHQDDRTFVRAQRVEELTAYVEMRLHESGRLSILVRAEPRQVG